MWSWTKNFVSKHKRKLISVGVIAGGIYAAGKLLTWKLSELRDREAEEYARQAKKQFNYDSNQRTCTKTFMQFMVILRDKIQESLNTEELITLISSNPKGKVDLWDELKIKSFTKAITSVASCCMLYAFLKVQMNIIGGYLYIESIENSEEKDYADVAAIAHGIEMDSSVNTIRKEYLNNVKFIFEKGINLMISDIEQLVKDNIHSISLKDSLSHYDLSKIVFNIWEEFKSLEVETSRDGNLKCFAKYLLDASEYSKDIVYMDEEKYQKIMSETVDVLESDDFNDVLDECVQKNLEKMMSLIEECFQNATKEKGTQISTEDVDESIDHISLPLAKLIPIMNAQMNQIFKTGHNEYLDALFSNEIMYTFSANIYESFSQVD